MNSTRCKSSIRLISSTKEECTVGSTSTVSFSYAPVEVSADVLDPTCKGMFAEFNNVVDMGHAEPVPGADLEMPLTKAFFFFFTSQCMQRMFKLVNLRTAWDIHSLSRPESKQFLESER